MFLSNAFMDKHAYLIDLIALTRYTVYNSRVPYNVTAVINSVFTATKCLYCVVQHMTETINFVDDHVVQLQT